MHWRVNTAQVLNLLLAVLCVIIFVSQYQQAHSPALVTPDLAPPPIRDPREKQYLKEIVHWQREMDAQQIIVTCPYLGHDNVARIDLPDRVPVTLADWDGPAEEKVAQQAYDRMVHARKASRLSSSEACIVHVYDTQGEEVARASVAGVVTSQEAPIE